MQLAGTLSGGEQQMLAMARADDAEPGGGAARRALDGPGAHPRAEVFRIIERLRVEGVTMLLVEQFAAAALNVADYGYVLENGRISVHGPADGAAQRSGGEGGLPGRRPLRERGQPYAKRAKISRRTRKRRPRK
jgi:ABC-type branched-subunit amino acid transport system ATPase component